MTDQGVDVLYRWDHHEADRETYDLIFDEAMEFIRRGEKEQGGLLLNIVNEWERSRRSVPITVLAKALELAEANRARRAVAKEVDLIFQPPEHPEGLPVPEEA